MLLLFLPPLPQQKLLNIHIFIIKPSRKHPSKHLALALPACSLMNSRGTSKRSPLTVQGQHMISSSALNSVEVTSLYESDFLNTILSHLFTHALNHINLFHVYFWAA